MARLWDKGRPLAQSIAAYTVGEDWRLDARLVIADAVGSLAHAAVLQRADILSAEEMAAVRRALGEIIAQARTGEFEIAQGDEDCHTAIEMRLTALHGDIGKKIHTGRSRNDQSLTAIRIYGRDVIFRIAEHLYELVRVLLARAAENDRVILVGRTHAQPAMLSSLGMWYAAFAEQLLDDGMMLETAYRLIDRCPLGSAAGYGVPLPLDREYGAQMAGFRQIHHNVLAASNSRGRTELALLQSAAQIGLTLGKLAQEMIFFALPEIGYFRLPEEICTGSSIMPHKRNPDVLELVRARTASLSGYAAMTADIVRALPSGYNRDFQETKGAFLRGCDIGIETTHIMRIVIEKTEIDHARITRAVDGAPEILSVDRALALVEQGVPFRDAYRRIGSDASARAVSPDELARAIERRTSTGGLGALGLDHLHARMAEQQGVLRAAQTGVQAALGELTGGAIDTSL